MFRGHWLVADVDGTLVPTPSRAGGKYFSLAHSAAFFGARYHSSLGPLRLFLQLGGSLCVVSTAGRRLWYQLYEDLGVSLFPPPPSPPPREGAREEASSATVSTPPHPGRLLICGFTGAALFKSRPPDQVWQQYAATTAAAAAAAATSSPLAPPLAPQLPPPAAMAMEEWQEYRQQAAAHPGVIAGCSETAVATSTTTLTPASMQAAVVEGQAALVRFFEHVSFVCDHDAEKFRLFFETNLSTKYHTVFTSLLVSLHEELRATNPKVFEALPNGTFPRVCFAHCAALDMAALTQHGRFLIETNDALVDMQAVPLADGTVPADAPVAQVVVMGIPFKFFNAAFYQDELGGLQACPSCSPSGEGAAARLHALGIELKSQPNSVCLHRAGIDKATCVRWLIEHGAELDFSLERALSFGDVPESVDLPLTQFPPMRFVSVSPKVPRGGNHNNNSDGDKKKSVDADSLALVGGEEEGTAIFLEELIANCIEELSAADAVNSKAGGCASSGGHDVMRTIQQPDAHAPRNWFSKERVQLCVSKARVRVEQMHAERASPK